MPVDDKYHVLRFAQVGTEHVLLGLVAEDSASKHGYLNSGLSLEATKTAVEALTGRKRPLATNDAIPFSREVRRNFELATNVSGLCDEGRMFRI